MSLRPLFNATALVIVVAVVGWLVYVELVPDPDTGRNLIAPTEEQARHEVVRQDPLIDLRFVKANRETNFAAFGLPEDMAKKTYEQSRRLEEMYSEKLALLLHDSADPLLLADALCGDTSQLPARYAGVRFFVKQDETVRRPINLQRVSQLERQDWSLAAPVEAVYAALELIEDRQADATLMGVAAIMLGLEQDAIDRHKPWGRTVVTGGWSWKTVVKTYPQIEEHMIRYFALLHVMTEMAQAEDGICGQ